MSDTTPAPTAPPPRRYQFTLYGLMVVVTLVCLWAASAHWPAFQLAYHFAPWAVLLASLHLLIMFALSAFCRLCRRAVRYQHESSGRRS